MNEFTSRFKLLATITSLGLFILLILAPLFCAAYIIIDDIYLWIWIIIFIVLYAVVAILEHLTMRNKFSFWMDAAVFHPRFKVICIVLTGLLIACVLWWWFMYIFFQSKFGVNISYMWPIFVLLISLLVGLIIFLHHTAKKAKKDDKGKRLRFVRGKREEVSDVVSKTLDALRLKYILTTKGSKWTMQMQYYQIEGHKISISMNQSKVKEVRISIKSDMPDEIAKANEIEKGLDQFLNIVNLN